MHKHTGLKKLLIIRFSSIGDIVLTTPVIRCLKTQLSDTELHYCTKKQYAGVLQANPYIDKLHLLEGKLADFAVALKRENFDFIIDLHKSMRSRWLRLLLRKPSSTFPKLNLKKWLLVNFRVNLLPDMHIVDRYFKAVNRFGVTNDGNGLDYFIPEPDNLNPAWLPETHQKDFVAFVIGGRHFTKIFPVQKVIEVCQMIEFPIVLLGGTEDFPNGEAIVAELKENAFNACGKFNFNQSAALVKHAKVVITNDTGLMHVAAALRKKIISLWGNTVPEFGMFPYLPEPYRAGSILFEVKGLDCRPCSKIGHKQCPKKHFACMKELDSVKIAETANSMMRK